MGKIMSDHCCGNFKASKDQNLREDSPVEANLECIECGKAIKPFKNGGQKMNTQNQREV